MSITKRISQLFYADVHGILDLLEEPEGMARQALREMEESISEREGHIALLAQRLERKDRQKQRSAERIVELESKIALCLGSEDQEMAKSLIRKTLEYQQLTKHIEQQLTEIDAEHQKQSCILKEDRARLDRIKEKLELCLSAKDDSSSIREELQGVSPGVGEDEVHAAYLEALKKHQGSQKNKGE